MPATALGSTVDRDHDRLPDRWEKRHGLSVKVKDARIDADRDGLSALGEFRSGTDPQRADSDLDSVGDGDEDRDRDRVDNATKSPPALIRATRTPMTTGAATATRTPTVTACTLPPRTPPAMIPAIATPTTTAPGTELSAPARSCRSPTAS